MLTYLLFSLKDGSFGFSGIGHDWTPTGLSFRPESTDVANEVPSCPGLSAFCSWLWWLITQDVVVGGVRLVCVWGVIQPLPRHHFPFFIQKQHRASEGADCTPDSIDCFPTLLCLFLFIWPLYFRVSQSLFWLGRNLLFYFWLPCSPVNASIKKRTWGGRGSGVPVCCPGCLPRAAVDPAPQGKERPLGRFPARMG